jgi:hypothetical protein
MRCFLIPICKRSVFFISEKETLYLKPIVKEALFWSFFKEALFANLCEKKRRSFRIFALFRISGKRRRFGISLREAKINDLNVFFLLQHLFNFLFIFRTPSFLNLFVSLASFRLSFK